MGDKSIISTIRRGARPLPRAASRTSKVLCIDSEDDSRLLVAEVLYECDVDFALTADDAVQLVRCRAYDMYFLDPAVVGFNDSTLLQELRSFDSSAPVIVCSSSNCILPHTRVDAVLEKPLSAVVVRETARRLLAERKSA